VYGYRRKAGQDDLAGRVKNVGIRSNRRQSLRGANPGDSASSMTTAPLRMMAISRKMRSGQRAAGAAG